MIRFLPFGIELFLVVFCLIDCIQSDEGSIRNLGRTWWILLILFFPLVGAIGWLVAGRPVSGPKRTVAWPSQTAGFPEHKRPRRSVAPDDDPAFLAEMHRGNAEPEALLKKWEDDLRRRERELGKEPDDQPPATT